MRDNGDRMPMTSLLALALAPAVILAFAAVGWAGTANRAKSRTALGVGIASVAASIVAYAVYCLAPNFHELAVLRLGWWCALGGLVSAGASTGQRRGAAVGAAVLMVGVWALFGWAPA